jgi:hypothetical protein
VRVETLLLVQPQPSTYQRPPQSPIVLSIRKAHRSELSKVSTWPSSQNTLTIKFPMCLSLFGWKCRRRVVAEKRVADDSIVGFGTREGNRTRNLVIGDDDRPTLGQLDDWQHGIENAECQKDGEKHAKCGSVYSDQGMSHVTAEHEVNDVEKSANTAFDDAPIRLRYPDYVDNQHHADDDKH